jgi:2-C-methyl-D-erythritol 4-phosphate cytidylyltransferase
MQTTTTTPGAIVPLDETVAAAAVSCHVAGRPALARVLDSLLGAARVPADRVMVVAAPALVADARSAVAEVGLAQVRIVECDLPATRARCIASGFEHLAAEPDSVILIHDLRSPLASEAVTDRVLTGLASGHDVVVPALPMTDTVKETDDRGAVRRTIDRQALRTVQYPRGYRAAALGALLDGATGDEFAAAVHSGVPIEIVGGDVDAVTATLPADAALLEAILASRRT